MSRRPRSYWLLLGAGMALFAIALVPIVGGSILGDARMIFLHGGFFVAIGMVLLGLSWGVATGRIS